MFTDRTGHASAYRARRSDLACRAYRSRRALCASRTSDTCAWGTRRPDCTCGAFRAGRALGAGRPDQGGFSRDSYSGMMGAAPAHSVENWQRAEADN